MFCGFAQITRRAKKLQVCKLMHTAKRNGSDVVYMAFLGD